MTTQHKGVQNIHQQLTTTNRRLTTIVRPPSIMRVELMKRRGIMPTSPMVMLAMQGVMQRKLVNITLRNTPRKNRLINRGRNVWCSQKFHVQWVTRHAEPHVCRTLIRAPRRLESAAISNQRLGSKF